MAGVQHGNECSAIIQFPYCGHGLRVQQCGIAPFFALVLDFPHGAAQTDAAGEGIGRIESHRGMKQQMFQHHSPFGHPRCFFRHGCDFLQGFLQCFFRTVRPCGPADPFRFCGKLSYPAVFKCEHHVASIFAIFNILAFPQKTNLKIRLLAVFLTIILI